MTLLPGFTTARRPSPEAYVSGRGATTCHRAECRAANRRARSTCHTEPAEWNATGGLTSTRVRRHLTGTVLRKPGKSPFVFKLGRDPSRRGAPSAGVFSCSQFLKKRERAEARSGHDVYRL